MSNFLKKFLGVLIDGKFHFANYIEHIYKNKLNFLSIDLLKTSYYIMIYLELNYGILA